MKLGPRTSKSTSISDINHLRHSAKVGIINEKLSTKIKQEWKFGYTLAY